MFKACPKCGKIHAYNTKCTVGVDSNRYKTDEDKLRNTYSWHKKSKQIREEALNLCEVCRDQGIYTYDKLEVHHIEKVRENTDKLLDDNNLICLCTYHHKLADKGKLDMAYLKKLVERRLNTPLP
jgi:hypothetical protein